MKSFIKPTCRRFVTNRTRYDAIIELYDKEVWPCRFVIKDFAWLRAHFRETGNWAWLLPDLNSQAAQVHHKGEDW